MSAIQLLQKAYNHLTEQETYEEATTDKDLADEINIFLNKNNFTRLTPHTLPECNIAMIVKRKNGEIYIATRTSDSPYSQNTDLSANCYWHGYKIPKKEEAINNSDILGLRYTCSFSDITIESICDFSLENLITI